MENASKALIIAGAILISILLISVGIIVMNAINDPISSAGDSAASQAIEIFNSKFTAYIGGEVDPSTVRQLFTTVNSTNAGLTSADNRYVTVTGITSAASLKSGKTYKVEITDAKPSGTTDGYYDTINISEN